jgi:hypothetical protein
MPCDHRRWFDDHQNIRPSPPQPPQHDRKEPIEAAQQRSATFALQHRHLMAQGEDLQREVEATAKESPEGRRK